MSEEVQIRQGNVEGWHVFELMGHRKEIGFTTTEAFGPAVLFRVETPELPEREFVLTRPEYADVSANGRQWCPIGSKVKRAAVQAKSCLVSPNSIYAVNPCTEEFARAMIERNIERPLILLELPAQPALPAAPSCCPDFPNCNCAEISAALQKDMRATDDDDDEDETPEFARGSSGEVEDF